MTEQPHTVGVVPPITLGLRIRAAREHAGLEQGELADKAGVARGTLGAAERGQRTPNNGTLTLIAWACGVDAHWLKTGKTGEAPSPDGERASGVRPEGFEPPTFCLGAAPGSDQRRRVVAIGSRRRAAVA